MAQKKLTIEAIESGIKTVTVEFLKATIALLSYDKKQKELTYVAAPVSLPNGGTYLVAIMHIDGPKFDMAMYREVSESQKQEDKPDENSTPDQGQ